MLWPWRAWGLTLIGASGLETGAFGRYLTARALRIDRWDQAVDVESRAHMDEDPRPDAGGLVQST